MEVGAQDGAVPVQPVHLRGLRRADGDTQLAALGALVERVELHGGGRMRVVYRGGAAEPVELHVGGG